MKIYVVIMKNNHSRSYSVFISLQHRRKIEIYDLCSVQATANMYGEYSERCTRYQQFCVPTFKHLECRYKGLKFLFKTIAYTNYDMFIVILANGRIAAIVSTNSVLKLLLN